jgi:hypothetical protein
MFIIHGYRQKSSSINTKFFHGALLEGLKTLFIKILVTELKTLQADEGVEKRKRRKSIYCIKRAIWIKYILTFIFQTTGGNRPGMKSGSRLKSCFHGKTHVKKKFLKNFKN